MGARLGRANGLVGAAMFAALALGACQAPPQPGPETASGAQPAAPRAPATQPQQVPAVPAPEPEPKQPETAALPPEPKIDDDPARIMGLDGTGLTGLLGEPELVRREPPAEIWQYRGASCVFDVFLYEEAGRHRVTYLEARDDTALRIGARGCLNELLRARLAKPLG